MKKVLHVFIDAEIHKLLKKMAIDKNIPLAGCVELLVKEAEKCQG